VILFCALRRSSTCAFARLALLMSTSPGTGRRLYPFTAIDDCTRIRVLKIYDACSQRTATQFIDCEKMVGRVGIEAERRGRRSKPERLKITRRNHVERGETW